MLRLFKLTSLSFFKPSSSFSRIINRGMTNKANIPPSALQIKPEETVFAKIVSKQIPSKIVYEDDLCLAFNDISPVAPVHILVIPKQPMGSVSNDFADAATLGHCMVAARKVAEEAGLGESGFRLVVNNGPDSLQSVNWLHIHVIGGKKLSWPPGVPTSTL